MIPLPSPPLSPSQDFEETQDVQKTLDQRVQKLISQLTEYLDFPFHGSTIDQDTIAELKEIMSVIYSSSIVRSVVFFDVLEHDLTKRFEGFVDLLFEFNYF